ncbi:MAG: hypothetical protein RL685_5795 [Pseudomonadota bacterium]|jgi:hypothetical protein
MAQRHELERYARSTWLSFEALVVPETGLPADYIGAELEPGTRARYTSPSNIAMVLWATLAARDLHVIPGTTALRRVSKVLDSLTKLERHDGSGQFYNWYDPSTLAKLTSWPEPPHAPVYPFASSVDNGWLASALLMVANAMPAVRERALLLAHSMNFGCYHDAGARAAQNGVGLLRGGFWREGEAPPGSALLPRADYAQLGETLVYTGHHYGAFNTETRIASYLAIALGQVPAAHYFAPWRTFPDTSAEAQGARPVGEWQTYLGVRVFEGAYRYRGRRIVPSWGGSMFEALMPALVVPEEQWGRDSWAVTHPLFVQSQIEFGLDEARYGYWGFSPAWAPEGGYREYGVPALGMDPSGYPADAQRHSVRPSAVPRRGRSVPFAKGNDYGQGVVTPHAAFLALDFAPEATLENLRALLRDFPALYGAGGFKDSVNVATGQVAPRYLALDQGMVLAAIANALLQDQLQSYLASTLRASLQPLMAMERFGAGEDASELDLAACGE